MPEEPILTIRDSIEFSYAEDDQVIYTVPAGLELYAGKAWCIYGVSGSGKSTLMTLLASLRRFDRGALDYRFRDRDPIVVSPDCWDDTVGPHLWRRVGFAFQRPELIRALDVEDNLKLVLNGSSPDKALFDEKEWGPIRRSRVWQISGGQIQRLGLARAFGREQDLVFLDEPTNNLDRRNRKAVAEFVKTQSHNRALVVVSHDDDFIRHLEIAQVFTIRETSAGSRVRRILEASGQTIPTVGPLSPATNLVTTEV